ncbi:unnamed protein product [Brachionus calyciflorus]|uniref:Integrase catalytic domain-containing protein n=1 Tax=Brachionus calyciflorus TaxID=104777 RepID=A0A814LIU7_9BILA|nr:unnamed protein product [Brachionus calyciflorus]
MVKRMVGNPYRCLMARGLVPMEDGSYWYVNFCSYSQFFEVTHLYSISAGVVTFKLDALFTLLGIPKVYKTDNGPPFNSKAFSDFAKRMGFVHRRVTPLWPRANGDVKQCMKNLTKVRQNAKLNGIDKRVELQNFLRVYRDTPHTVTKAPPAYLMFRRTNASGLPCLDLGKEKQDPVHLMAQENDRKAKAKMKETYDKQMNTRVPQIKVGSNVFMKQERKTKAMTDWDPTPYLVKEIKHSMVTVERDG